MRNGQNVPSLSSILPLLCWSRKRWHGAFPLHPNTGAQAVMATRKRSAPSPEACVSPNRKIIVYLPRLAAFYSEAHSGRAEHNKNKTAVVFTSLCLCTAGLSEGRGRSSSVDNFRASKLYEVISTALRTWCLTQALQHVINCDMRISHRGVIKTSWSQCFGNHGNKEEEETQKFLKFSPPK